MPEHPAYASSLRIPYLRFHEPDGIRTMLYRFFNDRGTLLYVGITNDPQARWADHASKGRREENAWWFEVRVVHTEWFATRTEAEEAEQTAIHGEHPVHNSSHNLRTGNGRRWRSMYIHPMAREVFGDHPFTYKELSERLDIPYGTVTGYGRRLVNQGAFRKVGTISMGHRSQRGVYVAVDVPPALASPVQGPLLDLQ